MKTVLTAIILLISISVSAQFDVTSGQDTEKSITIDSKDYPILITANSSEYIVCNSPRTKNDYAVWIGEETDKKYEGKPVRMTSSGKYFIFVISKKSKNPYCKYLKEDLIQ